MPDIQQITCFQTSDNQVFPDYENALKHEFELLLVKICNEAGLTQNQYSSVIDAIRKNKNKIFNILEEMRDNEIL